MARCNTRVRETQIFEQLSRLNTLLCLHRPFKTQSTFPGFYPFVIVLYLMVRFLTKSLGMGLKRATAIYLSSIFRKISPELTPITLSSTTSSIEKFSKPYNTQLNYDFNAGFLHILECKRRHFSRAFSKPLLSFTRL